MNIRVMTVADYDAVYALWLSCKGMGLNDVDDSREDLSYRNLALQDMVRIDT